MTKYYKKSGDGSGAVLILKKPITMIGLMGAGKTAIGRRLARYLGVPFIDADYEIEMAAGCSVSDIFEQFGEEGFRDGERRVIKRLMQENEPHVLATGGGAFMNDETRALLKEKSLTIWLHAELDVLVERCSRRDTRPLLRDGNPEDILGKLVDLRYPTYAEAELRVESLPTTPDETTKRAYDIIEAHLASDKIKE